MISNGVGDMKAAKPKNKRILISRKQLARLTGARDSTIKFYTEQGLLPFTQAAAGLMRRYDKTTAKERLQEIRVLREGGLNIEQVKAPLLS